MVVTQGQKGTISHAGKEFKRGLNHCVIEHYMLSDHIMIPNDFMAPFIFLIEKKRLVFNDIISITMNSSVTNNTCQYNTCMVKKRTYYKRSRTGG